MGNQTGIERGGNIISLTFTRVKKVYLKGMKTIIKDPEQERGAKYPSRTFNREIVIHAKKGSLAEEYASKNSNTFVEI